MTWVIVYVAVAGAVGATINGFDQAFVEAYGEAHKLTSPWKKFGASILWLPFLAYRSALVVMWPIELLARWFMRHDPDLIADRLKRENRD